MYKHLLFDLDNTLYPTCEKIDYGINHRMIQFIADYLGVSFDRAKKMRSENISRFGTTLEWLITEKKLSPAKVEDYFAAVHPASELEDFTFDPNLRPFLISLHTPMTILTNAPLEHALRILHFLKIDDLFLGIYDIRANNFKGKPYEFAYRNAIQKSGFSIADTIFFDDHEKYITGYTKIGGTAVLIAPTTYKPKLPLFQIKNIYEIPVLLKIIS